MLVGPDGLATPNNPDTGSEEMDTFGIVYWDSEKAPRHGDDVT